MSNHLHKILNRFRSYRIVEFDMIGHRTAELQERIIFWETIKSSPHSVSVYQFLDECRKRYPKKKIEIVKISLPC